MKIYRYLFTVLLVLLIAGDVYPYERYNRVNKYDRYFSKYSKRYFGPGMDWRIFKAQAVAESRLRSNARSYVGAKGVMQIMPKTFDEIQKKNPTIKGTREQPRWNIAAGIWYDWSIWNIFKARRPFQDRVDFMMGAYNAGKGNVLKAQKKAVNNGLNPNSWRSIEQTLPEVTGKHSRETIGYVSKIKQIKEVLK